MSFLNSKYDLEINNVGLRIENYRKSETAAFIPRLGAGSQSESEFDLLKSKSIEDFSGGMLQREWKDDHAFFGSENLIPLYDDGVLYPVKQLTSLSNIMAKSTVTAWAQSKGYLYLAISNYNGPTYNTIVSIDSAGTITTITLPSSVSGALDQINSLVVWNNEIWGTMGFTQPTERLFWMTVGDTSFTEITAGIGAPYRLAVFQGQLYGTGATTGGDLNVTLYKYTGDKTTKSYSSVGNVGKTTDDYTGQLFNFNGRLMLTRNDGLYQYDGIRLAPVDDQSTNPNDKNFRYPSVLKGYLYYFMADGMYRFNGSMIEKLYDIAEVGFPVDMTVGKNRLWLSYSNSAFSGSSRYDKSMGYDYSSGTAINGRVVIYDGKAMFTYARTSNDGKPAAPDFNNQGENAKIVWFNNNIYVFTYYSKTNPGLYFKGSTDEITATGTAPWKVITSIFDADFAMVDKAIENIQVVLDGDAAADEDILIEYRTTGFNGASGWTTLGTLKTQSRLQEYVFRSIPAGLKFKKIQFRFSATTTLGYGIRKLIFRYLLVPDFKWQWNFTINMFGDNPLEPLMLKDGTQSTQKVATLRGLVYDARSSGIPVGLTDIDQLDLNGAHNSSVTTININTTALLKPAGFVKIDDEIIRYTGKTATTLTGCERGSLGTAAASHSDNAAVFPYYRVLVRTIQQERIEMDDSDLDRTEDFSKPSQLAIVLQEV